jgi:5-formyltetrahydrofolate cyclo-ligase
VADVVDALPEVRAASTLAAFAARADEPPTAELLARWRAQGRRVLLPVVLPDLDLDWALDDGHLRPSAVVRVAEPGGPRLGPDAIAEADVVLVPALAVDRRGVRLGQGGGSYDRALARVRSGALVVALLHPGELQDEPLPAEPHDHPVHVVVTVEGAVRLPTSAG